MLESTYQLSTFNLTFSRRDVGGNLVNKVTIDPHTVCKASLRDAAALILEVIVEHKSHLGAELLLVSIALDTVATGID